MKQIDENKNHQPDDQWMSLVLVCTGSACVALSQGQVRRFREFLQESWGKSMVSG